MLSIEPCIESDATTSELIELNYLIHKTDKQAPLIIPAEIEKRRPTNPKYAEIEEKSRIERMERRDIREKEIKAILERYREPLYKNKEEAEKVGWLIPSLIDFLLSDFDSAKLFNEIRVHPITYFQAEGNNPNLLMDFTRIIRCQNQKYSVLEGEQFYTRTFENIYVGSCVEGAAIMTIDDSKGVEHITNFKTNSFLSCYLWIYALVYIQRHTLIEITKNLMNIDTEVLYSSKDKLSSSLSLLSMMKVNAFFTDISDHTQHNVFYEFCAKNLSIKEHLKEVDEKIGDLKVVLEEQVNEEDKISSDRLERRVAFIAVLQVIFACIAIFIRDSDLDFFSNWQRTIVGVLIAMILGTLLWFFLIRKRKRKI